MSGKIEDVTNAQENSDRFYLENGPCCAGCDHWRSLNSVAGECQHSRLMPGKDRAAMLGVHGCSLPIGAGHALTRRDYCCGKFSDAFDWSSLPVAYLRRIGHPVSKGQPKTEEKT